MWVEDSARDEGRFQILRPLGEGSTATVSLAVCVNTGQRVALKVLKPSVAKDARYLRHFRREADVLQHVASEHVVTYVSSGELKGPDGTVPYLAMEVLHGVTLDVLLRNEGPLPPEVVARILVQILRGLGDLHRAGVVLRDPAMDNVMVLGWGHGAFLVKLIDLGANKPFGAAAEADSTPATEELPESQRLIQGRYRYTPPEFADGAGHSNASDLYAVGLIGFELATQARAVAADTLPELARLFTAAGPSMLPDERQGAIPGELFKILQRLGATDPSERYLSAESARLALESWLAEVSPLHSDVLHTQRTLRLPTAERRMNASSEVVPVAPVGRREPALMVALSLALTVIGVLAFLNLRDAPATPPPPPAVELSSEVAIRLERIESLVVEPRVRSTAETEMLLSRLDEVGRPMMLQCPGASEQSDSLDDPESKRVGRRKKRRTGRTRGESSPGVLPIDRAQIRRRKETQAAPPVFRSE